MNDSNHSRYRGLEAEELLKELGFKEPPYNPFKIAERLKIRTTDDLRAGKVGWHGAIKRNGQGTVIWHSPANTDAVQKFIVAHEIGHYIHHVLFDIEDKYIDDEETIMYGSGEQSEQMDGWEQLQEHERKANEFAAELLMPESDIMKVGREILAEHENIRTSALLEKMANRFDVSEALMLARLKLLGVLS